MSSTVEISKRAGRARLLRRLVHERYYWLLVLPGLLYFFIFHYLPMYGVIIAFQDFSMARGLFNNKWVGAVNFVLFFNSHFFVRILKNTIILSVYSIVFQFPIPIIIALIFNECRFSGFKKVAQTLSYLPHFISLVVVVGIMVNLVNPVYGVINELIKAVGGGAVNFMGDPDWFRPLYILSNIWQNAGWASIIYLAALSSIDPQLYESAVIDGAKRRHALFHITLPSILPTIIIVLIIRIGNLMSVGFEKIVLMYSPATYETADVISTFVYRRGLLGAQYSFGAAVGLFNSVINLTLLVSVNALSRRVTESSLW